MSYVVAPYILVLILPTHYNCHHRSPLIEMYKKAVKSVYWILPLNDNLLYMNETYLHSCHIFTSHKESLLDQRCKVRPIFYTIATDVSDRVAKPINLFEMQDGSN